MDSADDLLIDDVSDELESACQAAERQALGDVNPNSVPQPAVVAPDASQVFLPAPLPSIQVACADLQPNLAAGGRTSPQEYEPTMLP